MICSCCGNQINDDAAFCCFCGSAINKIVDNSTYTKRKCKTLRQIRKTIAEINQIEMDFPECDHEGPCAGTCPVCEQELRTLEETLRQKERMGEQTFLPDIIVDYQKVYAVPRRMEMDAPPLAGIPEPPFPGQMVPPYPSDTDDSGLKSKLKKILPWKK